ncbi:LPXTG cell wall anchor domain-containing protein [Cryobacterium sp. TMT1-2-2]|uniref:LPXTG cell wall anchor domain-containing protein n=1 Tax=Cryobacterium sp. TMT1-2-2 TaxID=1259233 RepID=UPI00106CFB53|nr:LPXTG cell wall anchor domain-containing protein [Cryobacterium sp. TMT1-2-2]TFD13368.1 LPXTG cell wall anchor domain-containing protein [Cryobacterium sp. TMT1-2-2]
MQPRYTQPPICEFRARAFRRGRLLGAVASALLLALPILAGAAGPASAAAPKSLSSAAQASNARLGDVQVSLDGVHFASSLPTDLFDAYGTLIPNGSMRASLWIHNPSDQPAVVRVSLRSAEGASAGLNQYLTLGVTTPADPTAPTVTFAGDADCAVLAPVQPLAAGATLRAEVRIDMRNVTGLTGQNETANLGLVVSLRDAVAGPVSSSACADTGVFVAVLGASSAAARPAALSRTGVDLPVPAIVGGVLLLGLGVLLTFRRRRERNEN